MEDALFGISILALLELALIVWGAFMIIRRGFKGEMDALKAETRLELAKAENEKLRRVAVEVQRSWDHVVDADDLGQGRSLAYAEAWSRLQQLVRMADKALASAKPRDAQ